MNAANEVAVDAFLHNRCTFTDIDRIVGTCMDEHDVEAVSSFEQLAQIDARTRKAASLLVDRAS